MRPEVLQAMLQPVIGHRGTSMEALMGELAPRLQSVFRTERPVYISTSSATGLMEAAIRNCVRERVLCLVCGAFSERFFKIAEACGRQADRLDVAWGDSNDPDSIAEPLARFHYDAVTVVHSETSTGVLNPIREIATAVREASPEALVLVDCVSSFAAAPLEVDEWALDFVVTGSQKALALPPGLALGVASQRAYNRSLDIPDRGLYFNFQEFERSLIKGQTANTPAVSLFYALARQLQRIEAEGMEARWARHEAMAERTWGWVGDMAEAAGLDLAVLAPPGRRSPAVTCITLPDGLNGVDITRQMAGRGYTIAAGYGLLKEKTIRIGHMGDHTLEELDDLLANLESVITGRG